MGHQSYTQSTDQITVDPGDLTLNNAGSVPVPETLQTGQSYRGWTMWMTGRLEGRVHLRRQKTKVRPTVASVVIVVLTFFDTKDDSRRASKKR